MFGHSQIELLHQILENYIMVKLHARHKKNSITYLNVKLMNLLEKALNSIVITGVMK